MTNKENLKRKKEARAKASRLTDAAASTLMTHRAVLQDRRVHDGVLVHTLMHDRRGFNFTRYPGAPMRWVERTVWATGCNRVLGVGDRRFSTTASAPTCFMCLVPKHNNYTWTFIGRMDWEEDDG